MSIKKQNIKRRMVMSVALAMSMAVLAAGTAHAATPSEQYPTASHRQFPLYLEALLLSPYKAG
jgi:hypothetical protein